MPGNRATNVLLARKLTPGLHGTLVAFYEHSVSTRSPVAPNSTMTWLSGRGAPFFDMD